MTTPPPEIPESVRACCFDMKEAGDDRSYIHYALFDEVLEEWGLWHVSPAGGLGGGGYPADIVQQAEAETNETVAIVISRLDDEMMRSPEGDPEEWEEVAGSVAAHGYGDFVTAQGNLIYIYAHSGSGGMRYYRAVYSEDQGDTWSEPTDIYSYDGSHVGGPAIISSAVDDQGVIHTLFSGNPQIPEWHTHYWANAPAWPQIWVDQPELASLLYSRSIDGGATWTDPVEAVAVWNPFPYTCAREGHVFVLYREDLNLTDTQISVAASHDEGESWESPTLIYGEDADAQGICISEDTLYALIITYDENPSWWGTRLDEYRSTDWASGSPSFALGQYIDQPDTEVGEEYGINSGRMTRLWYRSAVEDADDRFLILSFSNDGDESFWEWMKDGTTRLIAEGQSYDYAAVASVNVPPQPKGYSFWW